MSAEATARACWVECLILGFKGAAMSKDSRMKLTRSASKRLTKQRIILVSEGTKTELEYIELLKNLFNEITERFYLNILKKRTSKGDPKGLLEVLKKENKREFDADDEIWVLIDRDDWNKEHIEELKGAHKSLKLKTKDFQVLISNPKFELWLLYHFKNALKS